jgi:twitching motility two-component system response regulator PilH
MKLPKRVLVVDDDEANLAIYHEILDDEYILLEAETGQEALKLAQRYAPRIVILDVMLPDFDGYEVCRVLRRMSGMQEACIVMVSAKALPSECAIGMQQGADAYLTKPFDDADLLNAIRNRVPELAGESREEWA